MQSRLGPVLAAGPLGRAIARVLTCQSEDKNKPPDFLLNLDSAYFPKPRCDWPAQCRAEGVGVHALRLKLRD